jgi:hypothetical protein
MKAARRRQVVKDMRLRLLSAARSRTTITYGHLMKTYHLSRGRRLSQTIGEVDVVEYSHDAPGFAAIIVRKDTGFPGGGYFVDDGLPSGLRRERGRGNNPRLSPAEKRYVLDRQREIWDYYSRKDGS